MSFGDLWFRRWVLLTFSSFTIIKQHFNSHTFKSYSNQTWAGRIKDKYVFFNTVILVLRIMHCIFPQRLDMKIQFAVFLSIWLTEAHLSGRLSWGLAAFLHIYCSMSSRVNFFKKSIETTSLPIYRGEGSAYLIWFFSFLTSIPMEFLIPIKTQKYLWSF